MGKRVKEKEREQKRPKRSGGGREEGEQLKKYTLLNLLEFNILDHLISFKA